MKAITIHQPWASLIAHGFKRYETRGWRTHYRGPLAIHAGQKIDSEAVRMLATEYTRIWHDISPLPKGCIIAVAELVDCLMVSNWGRSISNWSAKGTPVLHGKDEDIFLDTNDKEYRFGDYTPGRYAWELANVRRIEPVPVKGKQGLWNWEEFVVGGGLCEDCIEQETETAVDLGLI